MAINAERAERARQIMKCKADNWTEFCVHWMASNFIYDEEEHGEEKERAKSVIHSVFIDEQARRILESNKDVIDKLMNLPPGDMRKKHRNATTFREKATKDKIAYEKRDANPIERLKAVVGVLYQVRCNLIHGKKTASDNRDNLLVDSSLKVLKVLLSEIINRA